VRLQTPAPSHLTSGNTTGQSRSGTEGGAQHNSEIEKPLPTYEEVVATYPKNVSLCRTNVDITDATETGYMFHADDEKGQSMTMTFVDGRLKAKVFEYGAKLTVTKKMVVEGLECEAGDKLTVDADKKVVKVSSWAEEALESNTDKSETTPGSEAGEPDPQEEAIAQLKIVNNGISPGTIEGVFFAGVLVEPDPRKGRATVVDLSLTEISDAGLKHLKTIPYLFALMLGRTEVSDAGMVHLEGHVNLKALQLTETQVTDAGLAHLTGMTELAKLELADTRVSDAGLQHVKGMTNLITLHLGETQITDAGLEHLRALTKLKELVN